MSGTAYHMEALRKSRVIERKTEAMRKIQESLGQGGSFEATSMEHSQEQLVFSEPGHYAQTREFSQRGISRNDPPPQNGHKKFVRRPKDDTIRKPMPDSLKNIQRDHVYNILHPYHKNEYAERIRHRRCRAENQGEDKVMPLMNPPEHNFKVPIHELPPRKPHFKV